ncbi:DUF2489 domain-containing protein [Burkholderia glumae]|uniref:DUF2489 domain-containing protein n=1 Tax=Burkholderia glumae TaxID=337 RepID=UPI000C279A4A|nr:DUF2489 domain-containing protein [Burkholderia glumae]PJO24578.1 DUF2489 domain-containing protein [Burkholderia glumae AU6208]QHE10780.1 DUF2489 domain-containing protein [Burkholderia glumae AU6208]
MNEGETLERSRLVSLAQAMLDGKLSFFEGAVQVLAIKSRLSGIADRDPDFDAFVAIQSETDHLPREAQRSLWSPAALAELGPEFRRTEEWAKFFAPQACRNLIARFGTGQHA